jgi:hypothetical protein
MLATIKNKIIWHLGGNKNKSVQFINKRLTVATNKLENLHHWSVRHFYNKKYS